MEISKELLEQVLDYAIVKNSKIDDDTNVKVHFKYYQNSYEDDKINIYELVHLNLKEWAKSKNVFEKIDWSDEPEQIFEKAEELIKEKIK